MEINSHKSIKHGADLPVGLSVCLSAIWSLRSDIRGLCLLVLHHLLPARFSSPEGRKKYNSEQAEESRVEIFL